MDELEQLINELIAEAQRKNSAACHRMFEALSRISVAGDNNAKIEARLALQYRNRC